MHSGGLARAGDQVRAILASNADITATVPIAPAANQDFGPFAIPTLDAESGYDAYGGILIADQPFRLTIFQGATAGNLDDARVLHASLMPSGRYAVRVRKPVDGDQVTFRVTNDGAANMTFLEGILVLLPTGHVEEDASQDLEHFLPVTHWSPADGAVVFTAATQLTCAGFPFVVDDTVCRVVAIFWEDAGGDFNRIINGVDGVSIAAAADVITVAGAAVPFAAGDVAYYVEISYQDKSFTGATDSKRTQEIDPLNEKYVPEELVDETNLSAATRYYPSADGMPMAPYKDLSIQGEVSGGVTVTVEARQDDAGTWLDITPAGYELLTNTLGNASFVDTNFIVDFDNLNMWRFRIRVVTSDATNAVGLWIRRKAL